MEIGHRREETKSQISGNRVAGDRNFVTHLQKFTESAKKKSRRLRKLQEEEKQKQ